MVSRRPRVAFVAWTPVPGRAADIASALGGVSWCDYDERWRGWLAPLRYARSAVRQGAWLARHRPRSVIATNPPIFCGMVAAAFCWIATKPFVLDSHPSAFGYKQNALGRLTLPLHRVLARHADAVLVTADEPAEVVRRWGGRPLLVHEPPSGITGGTRPPRERPLITFVGTFASDEPVAEVVEAARAVPEIDLAVTGRLSRAPEHLRRSLPPNVELVGWLDGHAYSDLLARSTAIVSLTTEPTSVMRSAYEAVYALRPLILTDTPLLRSLFADALFTDNRAEPLAEALRRAVAELPRLDAAAPGAAARQRARWADQMDALGDVLSRSGSGTGARAEHPAEEPGDVTHVPPRGR